MFVHLHRQNSIIDQLKITFFCQILVVENAIELSQSPLVSMVFARSLLDLLNPLFPDKILIFVISLAIENHAHYLIALLLANLMGLSSHPLLFISIPVFFSLPRLLSEIVKLLLDLNVVNIS